MESLDGRVGYWHLKKAGRSQFVYVLLLIAVVAGVYSNSFQAGLVFDNAPIIGEDPRIRHADLESVRAIVNGQYWFNNTTSGLYRPLTTLSYLFNYAVLGNEANPEGYHAVNLALHLTNVLLVFAIGLAIFADPGWAFALAALWGLHPLLTESVTNIVGRADLLAGFGVLAGLWCYIRLNGWRAVAGVAAAQAIGIFSKESAIALPACMLLYDVIWRRRPRLVAYIALALPIAAFFAIRSAVHPVLLVNFPENPLIAADFWTARITAFKVIGRYVLLFIWPSALSADHSYNAVPLLGTAAFVATIGCATAFAFAVWSQRRWPVASFFLLFFFVALAPTANIFLIVGSIMAERFMYLPALGLAGLAIFAFSRWKKSASLAAIGVLCVAFGARTFARNFDWYDALSLWTSATQAEPQAARAHSNLALEYTRIPGRMADAIAEYRVALSIDRTNPGIHFNLANALLATGRLDEAIAEYRAAVSGAPAFAEAHNNLGNALVQSGRIEEAIAEFKAALRIRPNYAEAHNDLANAFLRLPGHLNDAIEECRAALRINPDSAEAHANLGAALLASDSVAGAVIELQAAVRLNAENFDARFNLANALLKSGRRQEAIAELQALLRMHNDPEARSMLEQLK